MYPPQQKQEAKDKRRKGLGIAGRATREARPRTVRPPSSPSRQGTDTRTRSLPGSAHIAKVKGSFPKFDKDKYLQGQFIKTLREDAGRHRQIRHPQLPPHFHRPDRDRRHARQRQLRSGRTRLQLRPHRRRVQAAREAKAGDYGPRSGPRQGPSRVTVQEHVAAPPVAAQRVVPRRAERRQLRHQREDWDTASTREGGAKGTRPSARREAVGILAKEETAASPKRTPRRRSRRAGPRRPGHRTERVQRTDRRRYPDSPAGFLLRATRTPQRAIPVQSEPSNQTSPEESEEPEEPNKPLLIGQRRT